MNGILLPRNYFKFRLVKIIVSKVAYESLENPKHERFLTMDYRNVVLEIFFSDVGDVMLATNLFRPIRVINRTNSRPIWKPTCEDIGHIAKNTSFTPAKKNLQMFFFLKIFQFEIMKSVRAILQKYLYFFSKMYISLYQ